MFTRTSAELEEQKETQEPNEAYPSLRSGPN